jgi:hypothetical protein
MVPSVTLRSGKSKNITKMADFCLVEQQASAAETSEHHCTLARSVAFSRRGSVSSLLLISENQEA